MTLSAVFVLLVVCAGLSLLVCLPVMLVVRAMRRRRGAPGARPGRKEIPTHELPGLAVGVGVMFVGFALAYVAPDTWFGQQMTSNSGRIVFGVGLYLAYGLAMFALRRFGSRRPLDRRDVDPPP